MFKGIIFPLAVSVIVFVLYSDLAESQCTTQYCEDLDEANMLAVYLRNQEVVEQLQLQVNALNSKEERNQEVLGRLQQEITEVKTELASQGMYSRIVNMFDIHSYY